MSHNFHITPEDGIARPCSGNCRYGDNVISGDTAEEAQLNYAIANGISETPSLKKNKFLSNDTTVNESNIKKLIEEYDLDHGNSEVFIQNGEIFAVVEAPGNSTIQVEIDENDDIGEFRSLLADRFGEYDAEERFNELWSEDFGRREGFEPEDFYERLREDELYFREKADQIEFEMNNEKPYTEPKEKTYVLEEDENGAYTLNSYSGLSNSDVASEENLEQIIEDYELDYGNSEVYEQGGRMHFTIEAPDNATVGVDVPQNASVLDVRSRMIEEMNDFSAKEEFAELWSEEFGRHNGLTAIQFLKKLESDEAYYKFRAKDVQRDIDANN